MYGILNVSYEFGCIFKICFSQYANMIAKLESNCLLQSVGSEQTGLVDESQCRSCSPGSYCSEPGLSAVSGPCLPGQNKRPHH